jgi:hypothetical protein
LHQHSAPIHRTCNMNGSVRRDTGNAKTSALLHRHAFRQTSDLIHGHNGKLRRRAKRAIRLGSVTPHGTAHPFRRNPSAKLIHAPSAIAMRNHTRIRHAVAKGQRQQCECELLRPPESGPAFRRPRALRERPPAFRTMLPSFKFLRTPEFCLEKSHVQVQRTRGHGRLSNLNEVPIRVAHVAPQFRCVNFRLRNKFRAPRRPKIVITPDITHAKVQKDA